MTIVDLVLYTLRVVCALSAATLAMLVLAWLTVRVELLLRGRR